MSDTPILGAAEAIRRFVHPGDRILLGTGAGLAKELGRALVADAERLDGLRLLGGLQLGDYPFMGLVRAGRWQYDTWHVMPPIRDDVAAGRVGFHLCRGALVPDLIRRLNPNVFLTTVSPSVDAGLASFGASVSYAMSAANHVERIIAELNPEMPVMHGNTKVPMSTFNAVVEVAQPLDSYTSREPSEDDRRIAAHIRELLPDGVTVQCGIGAVPEALIELLGSDPPAGLRLFGMGIDRMIPILEKADEPGTFVGGELLGTNQLYRFAHNNPVMENHPISEILRVPTVAEIPRFASVNGAIEIDLTGQVNAEWAGGRQVSGAGGSFDFVDSSWFSDGGLSIIALRSTARGGKVSTIVPRLEAGTPVTTPRSSVRFVVTEHGSADLWGLTVGERAEALMAVAHPDFHNDLEASLA